MSNPLFIGLGSTPVCWYRIALPANQLDVDWIGLVGGPPPTGAMVTGNIEEYPKIENYDTFIVQQPYGPNWLDWIKEMQNQGKTVLFEVDDFLHGVGRIKDHARASVFHKQAIREFVTCMKQCDGMICSTDFLSDQYKKYNPNQYVCKVGLDAARYQVEFPERDKVVIGWAGGTGHSLAIGPWLESISDLMFEYEEVSFVSIGIRYADALSIRHPGRCLSVPWATIENLPYTLTHLDCYIAPFHDSKYFRSKSDLRWLEGSAVGIPGVLATEIYHEVENEVTGLLASGAKEAREQLELLILDKTYREKMGTEAKKYVSEQRNVRKMSDQWEALVGCSPHRKVDD